MTDDEIEIYEEIDEEIDQLEEQITSLKKRRKELIDRRYHQFVEDHPMLYIIEYNYQGRREIISCHMTRNDAFDKYKEWDEKGYGHYRVTAEITEQIPLEIINEWIFY